jgi:transposase-like protein
LRAEVDELFAAGRDLAAVLEDVARVSVRLMMQTAMEAEADAFLAAGATSVASRMARRAAATAGSRRPRCTPRWVTSPCNARSYAALTRCSAPGCSAPE